jgi:hypothetical protein
MREGKGGGGAPNSPSAAIHQMCQISKAVTYGEEKVG